MCTFLPKFFRENKGARYAQVVLKHGCALYMARYSVWVSRDDSGTFMLWTETAEGKLVECLESYPNDGFRNNWLKVRGWTMDQMELPSSGMANFLLFFFHVPFAVLLPCHSTMSCQSLFQSLLKLSFSAHFQCRLHQFLCMHVTYKVYLQMPSLHPLSNFLLCLSLRGFDAFSWKNNFSKIFKMRNKIFLCSQYFHCS